MNSFELPSSFRQDIDTFATLLLHYNQTHNISGAKTNDDVMKNVDDSIYPIQFLDLSTITRAIDIGTGAGFPGFVLALALPSVHFTLFEPIRKKSAFLHLAKTTLDLKNVDICSDRVEKAQAFIADLICSRAVTNTKMLIRLCQNFIDAHTQLLFYKGELVEEEIKGLSHYRIHQREKRYYLIMKDIDAC